MIPACPSLMFLLLLLVFCLFVFKKGYIWLTISSKICVWGLYVLFYTCRLSLWILKNFAVSWRLCGRGGCIVIRFQSWCNPLWLTGLKEPTRKLTLGGWVISAYANCTPSKIPQGLILREGSSVLAWHDLVWEAQIASARFTSEQIPPTPVLLRSNFCLKYFPRLPVAYFCYRVNDFNQTERASAAQVQHISFHRHLHAWCTHILFRKKVT